MAVVAFFGTTALGGARPKSLGGLGAGGGAPLRRLVAGNFVPLSDFLILVLQVYFLTFFRINST